MAKKEKVQKVITIIKAKGQPDEVQIKRQPKQSAEPAEVVQVIKPEKPQRVKIPKSKVRITQATPRLR